MSRTNPSLPHCATSASTMYKATTLVDPRFGCETWTYLPFHEEHRVDPTFNRLGELKNIGSYPAWLGDILDKTAAAKQRVIDHPIFAAMREAQLTPRQAEAFLVNGWPVVEQFPQYMAMNLQKLRYGHSRGEDMARRFLTRNIRVEQNHADYWVDWAAAHDVSKLNLTKASGPSLAYALSHWCWKSSK